MKKLTEYVNSQYVSLRGIDEKYASKLKNLQGKEIFECCCDGCACDTKIEPIPGPAGVECNDQAFTMYFWSEVDIVEKLKTTPNVQDLYNLHSQFSYNRFALVPQTDSVPLVFTEKLMLPSGELMEGRSYTGNLKLIELINKSELNDVVVLIRLDNSVQVFGLKHTGTNGKEGSIKNSLIEVAKKLTEYEKVPEIKWSQVLDVSIDNADDVYTFLLTFTVDANDIPDNPVKTGLEPQPIGNTRK